jgi:hypothetical protein
MADDRRGVVESIERDPETQLGFALRDRRIGDAELEELRELARSGAVEAAPDRSYAVNQLSGLYEHPAVVLEDPPGRYRLNPAIVPFAGAAFERELCRRQDDRARQALLAALASLPARHLRVIRELCAPPRPLESALHGREVDDPDGFVSAVNAAARRHGISDPQVEASGRTVRATNPPDHLVGAMLDRLKREADQRELDELAGFLGGLGREQTALLRHLAGLDLVDEETLRRLDPQGDLINEQASRAGFTASAGPPGLVRRNGSNQWSLPAATRRQLQELWRPPRP